MTNDEQTFPLHAHLSTESRDCDGRYNNDYVLEMNDDEARSADPDEAFRDRVFQGRIYSTSEYGMSVKVDETGFEWNEATDEGYRAGEVRWCRDDCDLRETYFRDHTAESMGY